MTVMPNARKAAGDAREAAGAAGLRYVSDLSSGIRRRRVGTTFRFVDDRGRSVDKKTKERARRLVIPPAWTEVRICPDPLGHLQATGRDAKGRKQHLYHPAYREVREASKFSRLAAFGRILPGLRAQVDAHMSQPGLPREKVLAITVHLLELTLIRVGNASYARQNNSFGLTTLRDKHVAIRGEELRFRFTGKSGKEWRIGVTNRRVAKILRACQELPGQDLLQYRADNGDIQKVTSTDVNAYLRELTGQSITAKDFRTWAGTVLATSALREIEAASSVTQAKRQLRDVVNQVAARLGNTPTICRKCYIHPSILDCYLDPDLFMGAKRVLQRKPRACRPGLQPEEAALLSLLRRRKITAPLKPAKAIRNPRPVTGVVNHPAA